MLCAYEVPQVNVVLVEIDYSCLIDRYGISKEPDLSGTSALHYILALFLGKLGIVICEWDHFRLIKKREVL